MFTHSVCSYPERGPYGDNKYRGNCTGLVIKDFIQSFLKPQGLFADPSIGGGTSMDVAKELGIRHFGTDLHSGFNLLRDDFAEKMGEQANAIFWHPPYWDMIQYSGNMWGGKGEAHKWDMSQMSLTDFTEALELSLMNIHDATERGGHYGILMGNLRRQGNYYNLSSLVERVAPGRLVDEIIKIQHNCVSDSRQYNGKLIRIAHEKLLVFRKKDNAPSIFFIGLVDNRASNMTSTTWRAAVRRVLQGEKVLELKEIYKAIEPYAKTRNNEHWQAKVRQILQDGRYFERQSVGVYSLAA